jgi:hypothetical protein
VREARSMNKIIVRKLETQIWLFMCRHGWKTNIKMDFKEIRCECVDCIYTWPRVGPVMVTVVNLWMSYKAELLDHL